MTLQISLTTSRVGDLFRIVGTLPSSNATNGTDNQKDSLICNEKKGLSYNDSFDTFISLEYSMSHVSIIQLQNGVFTN